MPKIKDILLLKARDIMTENVICIEKDTPIHQAIELLSKHNITGIPVVENDMTLIGILSEKDVLRLVYEREESKGIKTVNDFMTQPPVFFEEDESLADICDCLANSFFRRVPVTSKGKLVGIVSRRDVINEYAVREGLKERQQLSTSC